MQSNTYGYARVSTESQNLSRQIDALLGYPVARNSIFADKASGADFMRPAYQSLLHTLEPGDTLVIKSIDRLGRSYREILREWERLVKGRKIHIVVLDMPLLNTQNPSINDITYTFIYIATTRVLLRKKPAQNHLYTTRQPYQIH